jgi:putative MFS transporter
MAAMKTKNLNPLLLFLNAVLVVSALGYFVDVFDLYLFAIVRNNSLKDLGLAGDALTQAGLHLLNIQMLGMLIGGVFWGVLGDKKGRISVLFGSILLYSIANIANAFVHDVPSYALCRFVAGLGLAGELGASITLVAETLPQNKRSLGTTFVASIGVSGAVVASLTGNLLPWRTAYMIGGFLGLVLLIARGMIYESQIFTKTKAKDVKRGKFIALFTNFKRCRNYISCILVGVPVWYVAGVLLTLSPEIAKLMGLPVPVKAAYAVLAYGIGLTFGDVVSGLMSHAMKTRKKVIRLFLCLLSITLLVFFMYPPVSEMYFYIMYGLMGTFVGTWAVLMTMSAEMFGTNMRATATSTIPNFIRGSTVLLNLGVAALQPMGLLSAIEIVGAVTLGLAIIAISLLPESYHHHLGFNEKL